jgi:hypothetical protein
MRACTAWRLAQRDLFLLAARQPLAFALADLLALERDRLHALVEHVGRSTGMASVSTVAMPPPPPAAR